MSATIYFVRHAPHDNLGSYLAGRLPGVTLGNAGIQQAEALAERMSRERLTRILASPLERTIQTASAIARRQGLDVEPCADLLEIDFGEWSGKDFDTLNRDDGWRRWNAARSISRTPAGESMLDVQNRICRLIDRLRNSPEARVALVSHADVIRAAVAYYLGFSLDQIDRIEIAPASVTCMELGDWAIKFLYVNDNHPF